MSDINLLQSTKSEASQNDQLIRILNIGSLSLLGLVIIAAFIVYFGFNSSEKQTAVLAKQSTDQQGSIQSIQAYPILLADQVKLKNLKILLEKHLDWSTLLPSFFNVTLRSASYSKFVANKAGGATITGTVPDFQELDKLMQALQFDDGSGKTYVNDVRLLNIGISNDQAKQGVTFTIAVSFDKNLVKMQAVQPYSNAVPIFIPVSPLPIKQSPPGSNSNFNQISPSPSPVIPPSSSQAPAIRQIPGNTQK